MRRITVGFALLALGAPRVLACSADKGGVAEGGTSAGAQAGTGGTNVGKDGGNWPDGGGAKPSGGSGGTNTTGGAGGTTSGGGSGGTGATPGGAGGTSGGAGGTTGGAGGSGGAPTGGGSGGGPGSEICNNKDDDGDGQVDEGLTQACTTACGAGSQTCSAGVWGACSAGLPKSCKDYSTCTTKSQCAACSSAPSESCNLKDDDCDGSCDESASCRNPVHRSLNSATGEHFYTTSASEAACCGFTVELLNFYYVYKSPTSGLVPFYRCILTNGKHFYTQASNCEGAGNQESVLGYIATSGVCGATVLYRLAHNNGDHFYTTSVSERDYAISIGYINETPAGYVWTGP